MKKLDNELRKEIGKYFIDISKLVLGGVVLASVIKIEDISRIAILLVGILVTLITATIGFIIYKNKE
jgi:hypothetical protein